MYTATIGFFDGVHAGHRFLIERLIADAREHGLQSMVITFDEHPRRVLGSDFQPLLLTTLDEKCRLLRQTGIDRTEVLHFDLQLASLSARQFMGEVLYGRLGVRRLFIGYDNRFGHNREETFSDYVRYGSLLGMDVVQTPQLQPGGQHVSSSVVRRFLDEGRVGEAAEALGYDYFLCGTVVDGEHIGRTLGFPTANLRPLSADKLIPRAGAYAVSVRIDDDPTERLAMMNIGTRPTFGQHGRPLEVHLLDFHGNLYGHRLTVSFRRWLRPEQTFASEEALVRQLMTDRDNVINESYKQ